MKNFVFIILALVLFACQNNKSTKAGSDTQTIAELTEATFDVSGMTCDHCVASINKSVGELEGVDLVETTLDDSTTVVKFDKSKVTVDEIIKTIDSRGYKASVASE